MDFWERWGMNEIAYLNNTYPKSWYVGNLTKVVEILDFKRIPLQQSQRSEMKGSIPYYGASGIIDSVNDYIFDDELVLIGEDGENVISRNLPLAFRVSGKCWVNNHAHVVKPKNTYDIDYLTYYLEYQDYTSLVTGSAQPKITQEALANLKVYFPNYDQQQKIAKILNTVDNLIDKTLALIDKYSAIKQGMMTDLFSRGIDLTGTAATNPNYGQLRPSVEGQPELYKSSKLGSIPKNWTVNTLESLLQDIPSAMRSGPFGSALLKHELVASGIPLLGIDNIFTEHFSNKFKRFVTPAKFQELSKYRVRPQDVVITIMGTVGRCCVIPANTGKALSSKHLWTMTFDTQQVLPELICWQLNYAGWAKSWFASKSQGGIMEAIQSQTLKTLLLPTPPLDEQKKILAIYQNLNGNIDSEKNLMGKLQLKKKGLMQDLLTGKVRVN